MLNYTSISFIAFYHLISLNAMLYSPTYFDIIVMMIMYVFTSFGITIGYHRLWSHKSFETNNPVKIILAFAGAGATQGSIIFWTRRHRLHHRFSDTEHDPYGPQKGFLHSHILWIFEVRDLSKLSTVNVSDIKYDPIIKFQHDYYIYIALLCSFGVPLFTYFMLNRLNNYSDLIQCIIYPIAMSRLLTWHSTWFVNSLAHTFGTKPYGKSNSAKNHWITALLTLGEGNHNYHHEFPYDYRNGIKYYEYDPTKAIIYFLYLIGFAWNLKTREQLSESVINKNNGLTVDLTLDEYYSSERNLVIINNIIYDITIFIENHPGGPNYMKMIIRQHPDTIKKKLNSINNHTDQMWGLLKHMKVGNLKEITH